MTNMAVILEERGRGKFKPAPDYKVDEVKELLNKKLKKKDRHLQIVVKRLSLISLTMIPISGTCCHYFRDAVVWIWASN